MAMGGWGGAGIGGGYVGAGGAVTINGGVVTATGGLGAAGTVWSVVGEPVVAEATMVALTDANPPKGGAFYRIVVKIEEF